MKQIQFIAAVIAASISFAAEQSQFTEKRSLTLDGARKVIIASVEQAKRNSTTGVIAVVD